MKQNGAVLSAQGSVAQIVILDRIVEQVLTLVMEVPAELCHKHIEDTASLLEPRGHSCGEKGGLLVTVEEELDLDTAGKCLQHPALHFHSVGERPLPHLEESRTQGSALRCLHLELGEGVVPCLEHGVAQPVQLPGDAEILVGSAQGLPETRELLLRSTMRLAQDVLDEGSEEVGIGAKVLNVHKVWYIAARSDAWDLEQGTTGIPVGFLP